MLHGPDEDLRAALLAGVAINIGGTWVRPLPLDAPAQQAANEQVRPPARQIPLFVQLVPNPARK